MKLKTTENNTFYICKDTCRSCAYEDQPGIDVIKQKIPYNSIGIDIGAHVGIWGILLKSQVRKLYSFEPDKESFEVLKKNSEVYKNIIPYNLALWNQKMDLSVLHGNDKTAQCNVYDFIPNKNELPFDFRIDGTIQADKLDNILDEEIDFIKIDAEGSEVHILEGAQETLKRNKALLLIEFCKEAILRHNRNPIEFFTILGKCRYQIDYDLKDRLMKEPNNFIGNLILEKK